MDIFGSEYSKEIIRTIIVLIIFVLLNFVINILTKRYAKASHLSEHRTNLISKYIDYIMFALFCIVIFAVWASKSQDIFGFIGTAITVIGVALFAQWSILSNITSGVIMFFTFRFALVMLLKCTIKIFL